MAASSASGSDDEKKGGELVFCGSASFSMTGRKGKTLAWDGVEERNLLAFHRLKPLVGVKIAFVAAGCMSSHCLAIAVDGTAYAWGRNEDGQLGTGDTRNRYNPSPVVVGGSEGPFANGALGAGHSILVTTSGDAFGAGINDKGQLGIGRTSPTPVTKWTAVVPKSIASAACGIEHTAFLTKAGTVLCAGCPQYGQCGNGSEDKYLEKAGRESFHNISSPQLVSGGDFKALAARDGGKVVQVRRDGAPFVREEERSDGCARLLLSSSLAPL